jgi:hypothetical protein
MNVRIMHPRADRRLDHYAEPPCAVYPIFGLQILSHYLWDPAAGNGNIVRLAREEGYRVVASDIIHRDFELDFEADFLKLEKAPPLTEMVVSNPPYYCATEFVEHSIDLVPRAVMLLRLSFLESRRRSHIFKSGKLVTVFPFIERLPMMHRSGWSGPRASSNVAYAWFYFWRDHNAPATIEHISIHAEDEQQ